MKKLTIYGASDDLIEIKDDIREEFYGGSDEGEYVGFSDGTLLKILYNRDGCWKISIVKMNAEIINRFEAIDPDSKDYSDKITIEGNFDWVVCGEGKRIK
jgi:hypothetical protein